MGSLGRFWFQIPCMPRIARRAHQRLVARGGQLIYDWYLEGQMPSRYYLVIRWPLDLLIDDSGGFAQSCVSPR